MARLPPPLGSAVARSTPVSAQRVVNAYMQKAPDDGQVPYWGVGAPGNRLVNTFTEGPVRAAQMMRDWLYVVSGNKVYRVGPSGAYQVCSGPDLQPGFPVYLANNGAQLMVVCATRGYIVTGTTIASISDPDFPGASSVAYLDGYFIFTKPTDDGGWGISALKDGTSYDALDFATAESSPDPLRRVVVDHREVWLFGTEQIEIWWNSGNADFPFERRETVERGVMSAQSVAQLDNSLLWVGDDGIAYRAEGYTPKRISTHEVERKISASTDKANITGLTWTQEGHVMYALRIPGQGCHVYDSASGQWHERETFGRAMWRIGTYVHAYGKHFAGDDTTGQLYEFDFDHQSDGDTYLARRFVMAPVWAEDSRFTTHRLQADFEVGVGLTTGQGENPQVALDWSSDGGKTWSSERWQTLGRIGEYRYRAIWRRLGQARNRVYRFTVTDPVKVSFLGCTADIEQDGL
jgi:hypothetical protein